MPGLEITDFIYYWHHNGGGWTEYNYQNADDFLGDECTSSWIYKGPVLTPTQINEMLAAEREHAAKEAEKHRSDANPHAISDWDVVRTSTANDIAKAIRNLGSAP